MRKFKDTSYSLQLIIVLMSLSTVAFTQKLPKVQTSSIRVPESGKIDGKTTEWNDLFQAYNSGNHIYYTLSNDDNNLYLTARMDGILGSIKIFKGGLTFTIIPLSKEADGLSITFPVISNRRTGEIEDGEGGPLYLYSILKSNEKANTAKTAPLVSSANNAIKNYKEIHIKGVPGISDPLLSIYNIQDIMVGASLDKSMRYTYELAIPLKYLEAGISDVKSLKYNIKLRVLPLMEGKSSVQPSNRPAVVLMPVRRLGPGSLDDEFSLRETDFSGEYKLAPKQ